MPLFVRLKEGALPPPPVVMEVSTDPEAYAKSRARRERFDRNAAWFNEHAVETYKHHAGKFVCVAGEEIFVGDTAAEAIARARASHPEDDGPVTVLVPREKRDVTPRQAASMLDSKNPLVMEFVTGSEELALSRARRERFDRNTAWFDQRSVEAYEQYRGKFICVSQEQIFAADTAAEAGALARAQHPDDDGRFTLYIPKERGVRIYANRR
jgi:hypothetical protein